MVSGSHFKDVQSSLARVEQLQLGASQKQRHNVAIYVSSFSIILTFAYHLRGYNGVYLCVMTALARVVVVVVFEL